MRRQAGGSGRRDVRLDKGGICRANPGAAGSVSKVPAVSDAGAISPLHEICNGGNICLVLFSFHHKHRRYP